MRALCALLPFLVVGKRRELGILLGGVLSCALQGLLAGRPIHFQHQVGFLAELPVVPAVIILHVRSRADIEA